LRLVESGTIACIVISGGSRITLLDELVIPSITGQGFDEVVVVGPYHSGKGYRHLPVPDITKTTNDALIKRDVGTAATTSEVLVYLSDDHRLDPFFGIALREKLPDKRTIGVPTRFTNRGPKMIHLNMGIQDGYCGGHGMVIHRTAVQEVPWTVCPFHRNWDVLHTRMLTARGYELVQLDDCLIEDVEKGARPWV
jgi:hypothetical protein